MTQPDNPRVLIALDIDGVLNVTVPKLSEETLAGKLPWSELQSDMIGGHRFWWEPNNIERLRELLSRPDIEGAWLATWVPNPMRFRELEHRLGLSSGEEALIKHCAVHPTNFNFPGGNAHRSSPRWWKYDAASELRERVKPERFAWIDSELADHYDPDGICYHQESDELLLLRTDPCGGLGLVELDQLESWVDRI